VRSKELGFKRVWSTTTVVAVTGALLLTSATTASADYIRDKQWVIDVINFEKVWSESRGRGVTVAVVDTGVDGSHPDLTGKVLAGKDVTGNGADPENDTNGHGTGMASLIAGHGHGSDASEGVIGLAPDATILPIKAAETDDFDDSEWARGIRYAVEQGADVINLSFIDSAAKSGSEGADAIKYAQQHDVIVVAGVGNDGNASVEYPAKLPGVVAVGAVDKSLSLWSKSNYGEGVTLAAPGVDILEADPSQANGYSSGTGTSDATAYVSATAALVRAKYPNLSAGQVINRLIKSATFLKNDVEETPDDEYGYGIIRPYMALTMDIPEGAKEGPLTSASSSATASSEDAYADGESTRQQRQEGGASSTGILIGVGIAAFAIAIAVAFAVVRSRRNRVRA
jgi:type VII secretion-associated serine protease mycosin